MATKSTKTAKPTSVKSTKNVNSAKPTTPKSSTSKFTTTKSVSTKPTTRKSKPSTKSLTPAEVLNLYRKNQRIGDNTVVASLTGYSRNHISNIKAGRRTINQKVADAMFAVAGKRVSA
jgi:hypothetical protein